MATAVATDLTKQMYIDGVWCDSRQGQSLAVNNPADESVVAEVAYGSREEAERAIEAAARAFPAWRGASCSAARCGNCRFWCNRTACWLTA